MIKYYEKEKYIYITKLHSVIRKYKNSWLRSSLANLVDVLFLQLWKLLWLSDKWLYRQANLLRLRIHIVDAIIYGAESRLFHFHLLCLMLNCGICSWASSSARNSWNLLNGWKTAAAICSLCPRAAIERRISRRTHCRFLFTNGCFSASHFSPSRLHLV